LKKQRSAGASPSRRPGFAEEHPIALLPLGIRRFKSWKRKMGKKRKVEKTRNYRFAEASHAKGTLPAR